MDLRRQLRQCLSGRVCLIGLGNEDYGDDGFGVRLAEELRDCVARRSTGSPASPAVSSSHAGPAAVGGRAPSSSATSVDRELNALHVMLAGSSPERCISLAISEGFQNIVFLDAAEFGGSPGDVVFLNSSEMQARFPQISTHKISLSVLAMWVESTGNAKAWLLGVQPESIRAGQALSARVSTTLEALKQLLLEQGAWIQRNNQGAVMSRGVP